MTRLDIPCYISEPMLFCNHCGHENEPRYSLAPISSFIGITTLGTAGLILLAGILSGASEFLASMRLGVPIGVVGAIFLSMSYSNRRLFCASCGSNDLLPVDSPKAIEFKNRTRAFEHVVENRMPQTVEPPGGESKRVRFRP